jgi:hypothetical protein
MSKTTEKYGKPTFVAHTRTEANPQPTRRLKKQWARLDEYANKEFGKPYDALNDKQKVELHYNVKIGKYKEDDSSGS